MPESPGRARLTGWGGTAPTVATLVAAPGGDPTPVVRDAGSRGLIARGLGRSYGDAAQNAGGTVLEPLPPRIELLDGGLVSVSAGTSLHELIRELLPHGWFVPVSPGTRFVTVGGAIACDVHGKNHHRAGSFGSHVRSLELVLADGTRRTLTPEGPDADQFWATVGGLGLTGVITSAVLACIPVETGHMVVDTERVPDLDAVMDRLREADRTHTYTVAWLDTSARGRRLGRSVLTLGEHAPADRLPARLRRTGAPVLPGVPRATLPVVPAQGLVNRTTARAFTEAWFRKAPRRREGQLQRLAAFFHPLDGVASWNRVYGRRGFVQYQLVVPEESDAALVRIVERFARSGAPCFLSVLKRFGPADPGPLSFPMPGWTLALDLPASARFAPVLDELDRDVLDAGGRLYLAKDSRLDPRALGAMYPRLDTFRQVRATMDPHRVFRSDLSRRLDL